jgi:hypothetical protein
MPRFIELLFNKQYFNLEEPPWRFYTNLKAKGGRIMKLSQAAKLFLTYHKAHSKENAVRAYTLVLTQLLEAFGNENLEEVTTERMLSFLSRITEGKNRRRNELATLISWHSLTSLKTTLI